MYDFKPPAVHICSLFSIIISNSKLIFGEMIFMVQETD